MIPLSTNQIIQAPDKRRLREQQWPQYQSLDTVGGGCDQLEAPDFHKPYKTDDDEEQVTEVSSCGGKALPAHASRDIS